jgi:hypothetical protein
VNRREEAFALFLRERGILSPCPKCGGLGQRLYSSTAQWRGGIGGAAMTNGQCDSCWGSGDAVAPWPSVRELERELKAKNTLDAQTAIAQHMGIGLGMLRCHLDALVSVLEKESRRRKPPVGIEQKDEFWWHRTLDYFISSFRQWGSASSTQVVEDDDGES